jgi:hypothetical protein
VASGACEWESDEVVTLLEETSVDALEHALRPLLDDPALAERLGRRGRAWAEQALAQDATPGELRALWTALADETPRSRQL